MSSGSSSITAVPGATSLSFLATMPILTCGFGAVEKIVLYVLSKFFFVGYDPLHSQVARERREDLIAQYNAISLQCQNAQGKEIDVLYLPSAHSNKTGNVIVFAETTSYQDRLDNGLPSKYKHFLDRGADIVLWNPTETKCKQYAQDLTSVLKVLKARCPHQKIAIRGHCASVEPVIAAAAEINDDSISLILDRGYADALEFARSFTVLTKLPLVGRIIQERFSCAGMQKLQTFSGKIIFVAPKDPTADQIIYWKGKNFTYEMYEWRKTHNHTSDVFVELGEKSDHWSPWNAREYQKITTELNRMGIVSSIYAERTSEPHPERSPRTFFKRVCLPILAKAWC
jgi:hypothetical protein